MESYISPFLTTTRIACTLLFAVTTSGFTYAPSAQATSKYEYANASQTKTQDKKSNGNAYGLSKQSDSTAQENEATPPAVVNSNQSKSEHSNAPTVSPISTQSTQESANSPAGNNGFIKVNEEEVLDSIPNNDPHVGCHLKVEFYNYDLGASHKARVSFALHSPTASDKHSLSVTGNLNPSIGQDGAGGGNDLDAVETYRLAFTGTPHVKQGYHVKLTIHADGSRGADVKHKVFWVQPCTTPIATTAKPVQPGKILSTHTQTPNTATQSSILPASLPSTGLGLHSLVIAALVSAFAYAATLYVQQTRRRQL